MSFDDIKAKLHELRMTRKINTMRLNARMDYIYKKVHSETETRLAEHEKINNHIETVAKDLETEKSRTFSPM